MKFKSLFSVIYTVFFIGGFILGSPIAQAQVADSTNEVSEFYDPVQEDGLAYAHKKRRGETAIYGLINSFSYDQRFGGGFSVVLASLNRALVDVGLMYLPTGFKTFRGQTFADYAFLPVGVRIFPFSRENTGHNLRLGVAPGALLSADRFEDNFHERTSRMLLGLGGLYPSRMKNMISVEFLYAYSLEPAVKSENVGRSNYLFTVGLTL